MLPTFASVPLGLRKNERGRAEGEEQDITIDLRCFVQQHLQRKRCSLVEQPNDIISCMYLLPYVRGMAFLSNASPS